MTKFTSYSIETAPAEAKELMTQAKGAYGFVPGLYSIMAEAPTLLKGYFALHEQFQNTSFDADELTVVWQTINVENECHYCVPAHTGIAKSMKVDDAITEALRNETPLPSAKLEALRAFTLQIVRQRGNVTEAQKQAFVDAGYSTQQMLEVVLGYAQKILSNYTNHLAETPVDQAFVPFAWSKEKTAA